MQDNGYREYPAAEEKPSGGMENSQTGTGDFYSVPQRTEDPTRTEGGTAASGEPLFRPMENRTEGEYVAPAAGGYEYYDDLPYVPAEGVSIAGRTYARVGFWTRLLAWLLDLLIAGVLSVLAVWVLQSLAGDRASEPVFFNRTSKEILVLMVNAAYRIITEGTLGGTLGKRALRLKLISSETGEEPTLWQIFFRETFGRYLSGALLGIGYLMVFSDKGTLHDRLADTAVVYDL